MKISESTIRHQAHEIELYGCVACKKPYVNEINRGKGLEYDKHYREKSLDFLNNVIWSHESKFNFLGSDGKVIV